MTQAFLGTSTKFLILDSSFNPPTLAHYRLLCRTSVALSNPPWILLHSVQNADKPHSQTCHIQAMLRLMEGELRLKHPSLSIASWIVSAPRFVDKVELLSSAVPGTKKDFHFILGQDTLVRFFSDKYYPQGKSGQVYADFFGIGARIWVAPRTEGGTDHQTFQELKEQLRAALIESHHALERVEEWLKNLNEIPGWTSDPANRLSSTLAREESQKECNEALLKIVFPNISEYVRSNKLYIRGNST
jgi:nicotinic acid mononucleotide adenylyltransferase